MRQHFAVMLLFLLIASHNSLLAQGSSHALRFFGTGVGPPGQQDRALFAGDDNQPGAAGHTPIDVGSGSFTFEFWVRGNLADNATNHGGGDREVFDYSWIMGNIILDRDIWCGSERKYGLSLAGGFVQFGTAGGDEAPIDSPHTLEGNSPVLDGAWHHIAVVRDQQAGQKRIYVDGELDMASSNDVSQTNLSYPDQGIPVTPGQCEPGQQTPYGWFLVLAAEKHDAGTNYPSFNGFVDELRIWSEIRTQAEINEFMNQVLPLGTKNLVGSYRFEEGQGTQLNDSNGLGAPTGVLVAGTAGNGAWVSYADDPQNTAPIQAGGCLSLEDLGEAWSQWPTLTGLSELVAMVGLLCD